MIYAVGNNPVRNAFSLIELIVVIAVLAILSMVAVTGISATMRQLANDRAAQCISEASMQARDLARHPHRLGHRDTNKRYGVVIIDANGTQPAQIAVTYGDRADASTILNTSNGQPYLQRHLPAGSVILVRHGSVWSRLSDHGGTLGWMCRYETGQTTFTTVLDLTPCFVGVEAASLTAAGLDPAQCDRRFDGVAVGLGLKPRYGLTGMASGRVLIRAER